MSRSLFQRTKVSVALLVGLGWAPLAYAEARHALLLGVWDYNDRLFAPLPGIKADLDGVAAKLRSLGFEVTVGENLTLGAMKDAVDTFGAKLRTASDDPVGLFYFTGHGVEHEGKNYLVPSASHIRTKGDLDDEALSAQRVLVRMEEAKNSVNVMFLDCCRNTLSKGAGDLAPMKAQGAFIGFATGSDRSAGAGEHGSVYTKALLDQMAIPGLSITDMHTRVTGQVKKLTDGGQIPFQYSGLDQVFYFVPPKVFDREIAARQPAVQSPVEVPPKLDAENWLRKRLEGVARAYVLAGSSDSVEEEMALLGPQVDYYGQRGAGTSSIRKEVQRQRTKWPTRRFQVQQVHVVDLDPVADSGDVVVQFTYEMANGGKTTEGGGITRMVVIGLSSSPRIVRVEEEVSRGRPSK